jgi:hypothetical protein
MSWVMGRAEPHHLSATCAVLCSDETSAPAQERHHAFTAAAAAAAPDPM